MKKLILATLIAVVAIGGTVAAFGQGGSSTARVEVTVWQRVSDGSLYLSTRPEGGRWTTHQTPLDMSQLSRSGNFRQGNAITVDVPVAAPAAEPTATPTPAATGSLSISGTGPDTRPFVLAKGLWVCRTVTVPSYTLNGAIVSLYGKDEGWEQILAGRSIILVGPGHIETRGDTYGAVVDPSIQKDSVTSFRIDLASVVEWTFTCERP